MARKTQVILVDDMDGGEAEETVQFGLDGVVYEIDLSDENAAELREVIGQWVGNARRVKGRQGARRKAAGRAPAPAAGTDTQDIRSWARSKGYQVSDRGRISAEIQAAYNDAH